MEISQGVIHIARDFTPYPGGRYRSDGEFSGERFREEILIPALTRHEVVTVELDGTLGYGSGFLEEAFGGLVRYGLWMVILKDCLRLQTADPKLKDSIWGYIRDAEWCRRWLRHA